MKKLFLILIIFSSITKIKAADTLTYFYVDSATLSMYNKQEWKNLISLGNKAINNNIDYFYLRMRIGIAYYEMQEYDECILHFDKALEFNSSSETAMEYKYFALVFAAKKRDAEYYVKSLPKSITEKIKPQLPKLIDKIIFESGINYLPDFDTIKTVISPPDNKNYRLEKDVTGNFAFYGLGLNHEFNKNISLFHSFNLLNSDGFQQLYFNYNKANENNYNLRQYQYYIAPTYYFNNNTSLTLFGNFLFLTSKKYKYNFLNIQPIQYPPPMMPPPIIYIYKMPPEISTFESLQWVAGFNYIKNFSNGLINLTGSFSSINELNQIQLSAGYGFYFNKQKTFFSKTNITMFSQKPNLNLIISQMFKFKVYKQIWADLFGNYGKQKNYNDNLGYAVSNSNSETIYTIGTKLYFPIVKKLTFYLSYSYEYKNIPFEYIYFTGIKQNKETFNTLVINNYYKQHLIYGGLIWKF